jgi:DNA-binding MarR family transcriptional regulator
LTYKLIAVGQTAIDRQAARVAIRNVKAANRRDRTWPRPSCNKNSKKNDLSNQQNRKPRSTCSVPTISCRSAYGLTSSQYNILRILRGDGKPLPILEIANRTVTVVPGITGLIDRLEQVQLVRRQRCDQDRRVVYVALTDKGAKTLAELDGPVLALHKQLMGHLSSAEAKQLSRLLEKVRSPLMASP